LISVYSDIQSPRLQYVLQFLSGYYGRAFVQGDDPDDAQISYTSEIVGSGIWIQPSGLLSEAGVRNFSPQCRINPAGYAVLFQNDSAPGFDLFSAVFYLLSRYEEYGAHEKDSYGRFPHTASLAFRHGFLKEPLIHRWLNDFAEKLFGHEFQPAFSFQPTYDIDMAWSYKHKGFWRNTGGLIRSLLHRDGTAATRLSVLLGKQKDPFDSFGFLDELHKSLKLSPIYFIHAGLKKTTYDKNIPLTNPAMRKLVHDLAGKYKIGLHPSWASNEQNETLALELDALEVATGKSISSSRQHYIRVSLPHTYRKLIDAGIQNDYSMGYGSINGFRASVAVPFRWYDLERETTTSLWLHPFCFMDANSFYEQKQTTEQTESELYLYENLLSALGGNLITIWHNTILGSSPEFAGWSEEYASFLRVITDV
jgi:hypothetical protein